MKKDLRVVQFSFDVLVDKDFDTNMFAKAIADLGITVDGTEVEVLGATFVDDLTEEYNIDELVNVFDCIPNQFKA